MKLEDGILKHYPLSVDNKELGKFGVGIQLYLNFLNETANVFFLMFAISCFSVYSNVINGGLADKDKTKGYIITTLANQPKEGNSSINHLLLQTLPDIVYSIIFLIFISYFKENTEKQIKEAEKNLLITDFGIIVRNFDGSVCRSNDELKKHFEQFGKVIEAKFARNYRGTLLGNTLMGANLKEIEVLKIKVTGFLEILART